MARRTKWTKLELRTAVLGSRSIRQVIEKLGLVEAGGNYAQINRHIKENQIDISHFKGMGWNKGMRGIGKPRITLEKILVDNSYYQSFKLKRRLFAAGIKKKECEHCGWARMALDGRLPLELDHINGNRLDNRIDNLRVLCPNCHSLQPTHRGKNKRKG